MSSESFECHFSHSVSCHISFTQMWPLFSCSSIKCLWGGCRPRDPPISASLFYWPFASWLAPWPGNFSVVFWNYPGVPRCLQLYNYRGAPRELNTLGMVNPGCHITKYTESINKRILLNQPFRKNPTQADVNFMPIFSALWFNGEALSHEQSTMSHTF